MVTRAPDNADRHAQTDMPDEAEHALRFSRAREAQSNALIEDYVELIADLLQSTREARTTDIARRFGVSHPTAIKNIARLKSAGLVESRPYRGCFNGRRRAAGAEGAPPSPHRGRSADVRRGAERNRRAGQRRD